MRLASGGGYPCWRSCTPSVCQCSSLLWSLRRSRKLLDAHSLVLVVPVPEPARVVPEPEPVLVWAQAQVQVLVQVRERRPVRARR